MSDILEEYKSAKRSWVAPIHFVMVYLIYCSTTVDFVVVWVKWKQAYHSYVFINEIFFNLSDFRNFLALLILKILLYQNQNPYWLLSANYRQKILSIFKKYKSFWAKTRFQILKYKQILAWAYCISTEAQLSELYA